MLEWLMVTLASCRNSTMLASVVLIATANFSCSDVEDEYGPTPAGAADAPAPTPGSEPDPDHDPEHDPAGADDDDAYSIYGFSWVRPELAGLPKPGGISGDLSKDLAFLADEGVDLVISLTTTAISEESIREHGMEARHIPVPDGTAPTPEQIDTFVALVDEARAKDENVAVHCLAGKGRTGTMLAAWLIYGGQSAEEAIAEIRELRPGSIETVSQEEALQAYSQMR